MAQRMLAENLNEKSSWIFLCCVHSPRLPDSQSQRMRNGNQKLDADDFIGILKSDCIIPMPWLSSALLSSYPFSETSEQKRKLREKTQPGRYFLISCWYRCEIGERAPSLPLSFPSSRLFLRCFYAPNK